jgi:glycosyltransferase involved in cell wall biosynthesis
MLWDSWPGYIKDMHIGPFIRFYLIRLVSRLRLWDYYQSQGNIEFIANSQYIASRISKFYHRSSKVIYPPVDTTTPDKPSDNKNDFYLIVSVLSKYKNIDLAVRAFKSNNKDLVIAGDGPELDSLKSKAKGHSNIKFAGRVSEKEKRELMQKAKGFIFCSIEDFGITMVESIASNTPVIALRGGGALEIIKERNTGIFFDSPTVTSLNNAISEYEKNFRNKHKIDNKYIFSEFSKATFKRKIREVVGE